MAREAHYQHIFLPGPTNKTGFTSPRQGGANLQIPHRDRVDHSERLCSQLDQAWADIEQRQAVVHVERRGAYIEFAGESGFDLATQSLEATRSGIHLRHVRLEGAKEAERTLATVYVPHEKRGYFLKKIRAYQSEVTKKNKPKNSNLVNSISDIRAAVLDSFWSNYDRDFIPGDDPEWIEVWLGTDEQEPPEPFDALLDELEIKSREGILTFPERSVRLIRANRDQLERLVESSDAIAEFRPVWQLATFFIELENRDQSALVEKLLSRTKFGENPDVAICVLDTGVNNGHRLLRPVLDDSDLHTVVPNWNVTDDSGHGTLMAGTAAYGDLLAAMNATRGVQIDHCLESAKILPPPHEQNPKRLWGYMTMQGISRAEIEKPNRKRIVCLATTAKNDRDRGRPSSWSAAVDRLTSGYEDDVSRLVVISAGNVDQPDNWRNYPNDNLTNEVHDPGQAWNALTVGASTQKTRIADPHLAGYEAIAPDGGLSPFSTTSTTWTQKKWPIKPEVVFEGGNVARGANGSVFDSDDLKLLSTFYNPQIAEFAPFWATSAAAAQAAWMAAKIQVQYPKTWPETVRALIVHSANWTDAMMKQFLHGRSKSAFESLLRVCGYGLPSLENALYSASDSLTLISEATMQPFDRQDNKYVTRNMHLYRLPWPSEVLTELGEVPVTMRVTLSYFIEPGPGEIGWNNRYRYPSHGLRFDINGIGESADEFVQRINKQSREDGKHPGTAGARENWTIGVARNVGSIHSDIWHGHAVDLASSNKVAVYPTVGWWRKRGNQCRWNRTCRYSLIVSVHTPDQKVDIYSPVAVQVGIATPVVIKTTNI